MDRHNRTLLDGERWNEKSLWRSTAVQQVKQQAQLNPAAVASPSHEFSFSISLPPSSMKMPDQNKSIDLSPADEIFFHGHLLPLYHLSHLPISPRISTNSLDNFSLPMDKLPEHSNKSTVNGHHYADKTHPRDEENHEMEEKLRRKFRLLSLFRLARWRKARDEKDHHPEEGENSAKSKFDIKHVVKRYMRLVKPFLEFMTNRTKETQLLRKQQPRSFSGNLVMRSKKELRGRRGEYSAPASMKCSRTNSGLLLGGVSGSGNVTPTSSFKSDSTMEELQAAIQAAIAHCKNTMASTEDDLINLT